MRYNWLKILITCLIPILISMPLQMASGYYLVVNLGVLAYVLFMCDTIIGLRPKWLERFINLQNLYIAHGVLAVFTIILMIFHVLMGHVDGISNTLGYIATYISIFLCVFAIFFLTTQLERISPTLCKYITKVKRKLEKIKITREIQYYLHMLFPLIIFIIFLHVYTISYIKEYGTFYRVFLIYSFIFFVYYLYEGIYKKIRVGKYKVVDIIDQGFDSYVVELKFSHGHFEKIKGGQFIFIHSKEARMGEYHPFSVLSVDNDGKKIKLGIRSCGDFTKRFKEEASKGDIIKVKGVYGDFIYQPSNQRELCVIAGGIGIVPCISLLNSVPSDKKVSLIWGVNTKEEANIFNTEMAKVLMKNNNITLHIHNLDEKGFIDKGAIKTYTNNYLENQYYVCGPTAMMQAISKDLKELGINKKQVIAEGFIF